MSESGGNKWRSNEEINGIKDPTKIDNLDDINSFTILSAKPTSLSTLIVWNISKALEKSPALDIKEAVASAQHRLEQVSDAEDIQAILSEDPHERHLACALFAWQQLGHSNADSLCRFVEEKRREGERKPKFSTKNVQRNIEPIKSLTSTDPFAKEIDSPSSYSSYSMGPVIKLPVETKLVMRLENTAVRPKPTKAKAFDKGILNKIDKACCLDSECLERLSMMGATTEELRSRAGMLARREAERIELLERAEAAWKDLEMGYQRRLTLAEEKEDDITKQLTKIINERNKYKDDCVLLTEQLKEKSNKAENDRAVLIQLEEELYEHACQLQKLREETAKGDAMVAEQSCRVAQLDMDLQCKEEQARRKLMNIESELESARALMLEAEQALRAELSSLRDQIAEVSNQLLEEDSKTEKTKIQLEDLRQEKLDLLEDLENCKAICDGHMQEKFDMLSQKKYQLEKLKDKVMESRCKVPIAVAVEVKRTPSFVASCHCNPEDKILESCSCTSIRIKLLSKLLADLFGGLQSELGALVTQMPCQLLKCLRDKHNWDRTSAVKSNLKNYFTKLLVGELDIAIATSIEIYHTKWLESSCVDTIKRTTSPQDVENAVECRAQKLATQLAEQLFQERADELTQRARSIEAGVRKCGCKPKDYQPEACVVKSPTTVYWHQAMQDFTLLRQQIEDLKKESLKKDDLKAIEDSFAKIILQSSVSPASPVHQAYCPPDRDRSEEVEQRPVKKTGRVSTIDGGGTTNRGKLTHGAVNQAAVFPCLVKNTPAYVVPQLSTPVYWHQTMEDVTRLRLQIEDLKKDSIKKRDLRMMENKIAKIIKGAAGGFAPTRSEIDYLTSGNIVNKVIKKDNKSNKAQNQAALHIFDGNKPTSTKTNNSDINYQAKNGNKPKLVSKYRVEKPFKFNTKNDHTYAVNMCLCSTKRQQQKVINERSKLETCMWKQKVSKDSVPQISSNIKQSKPLSISVLSQDIITQANGKESEEQTCSNNCVCFHKAPSNISINELLQTLEKWKFDLDVSMDQCTAKHTCKSSQCDISSKIGSPSQHKMARKSILTSREKSQEEPILEKHKDVLKQPNASKSSTNSRKINAETTIPDNPIGATESEYIGTVNLEKSNEELCLCASGAKTNIGTPFNCITSKCSCEKTLKAKKLEGQMNHGKKENNQEFSAVLTKQEQRVSNIIVLENMSNDKQNNKSKSLEKETNIQLNNVIPNEHVLGKYDCDYNIKFLGVILTEANTPTKNKLPFENNKEEDVNNNILMDTLVLRKKCETRNSTNTKKIDQSQVYQVKNSNPVPEFSELSSKEEGPKNKKIKRKRMPINYGETDNNNEYNENCNECTMLIDYMKIPGVSQLNKNSKQKYCGPTKISSGQDSSNKVCDDVQFQGFLENSPNLNSYESEVLKDTINTSYDDSRLANYRENNIIEPEKDLRQNINITEYSKSDNKGVSETTDKQVVSCKCGVKSDEFKKFKNINFVNKVINEDVALDVQSLKHFNSMDEKCVCCNKLNTDESRNLEDNTFHLLEEYLKKKLDELKASYVCISQKEEEKIFTIILQRIKQLISDSINQITCKCSVEDGKLQGSWNRAYGLLQEYLKMKIKKAECSCLLAEDNKDTILPDVLEKICNLIEYDFKRLKNLWGYKGDPNSEENARKITKQVNFEAEIPENDLSVLLLGSKEKVSDFLQDIDDQVHNSLNQDKTSVNDKEMASQVALSLPMEIKYCDPLKTNNKTMTIKSVAHLYDTYKTCNYDQSNNIVEISNTKLNTPRIIQDDEMFIRKKNFSSLCSKMSNGEQKDKAIFKTNQDVVKINKNGSELKEKCSQISYVGSSKELPCKEALNSSVCSKIMINTSTGIIHNIMTTGSTVKNCIDNLKTGDFQKTNAELSDYNEDFVKSSSGFVKNVLLCNSKAKQINESFIDKTHNQLSSTLPINNQSTQISQQLECDVHKCSNVSNLTHTINCSCDISLETCICSKSISVGDNNVISNEICKNSIFDEICTKKVSLISRSVENINKNVDLLKISEDVCSPRILRKKSQTDNYSNDCKSIFSDDQQLVLIKSEENLKKCHITTNSINTNIDTDNSINEDTLDCCKCNSHYDSNAQSDSDRLKSSIYFPTPVVDFDERLEEDSIKSKNCVQQLSIGLSKRVCDCELVPICHVKMLVENIETKLVNANCTCDSLIPNVCPVHSTMC